MSSASSSSSSSYWVRLAADFESSPIKRNFTIQFDGQNESLKAHEAFLVLRWKNYPKLLQLVAEKAVNNVVTLTDDPVAFKRLFEYFHTAEFPDKSSYTDNEIIKILKLGSRYCPEEMSDVTEKLVDKEFFRLKNAYKMLNLSNLFGVSGLKDKASEYIDGVNRNPEMYLASADFLELEEDCMVNLLRSDALACPEIKLFEAVVRWGKHKQDSVAYSATKLRDILDSAIYQIRFPIMTALQVTTTVHNSGLLLPDEMTNLFVYFCADEATRVGMRDTLLFNSEPRAPAINPQGEESDDQDHTTDIDIEDFIIPKPESPIPSTSHSTPPLEESDDDSSSSNSRDTLFTPQRKACNLVADTWRKMMVKVKAGEIPKNTTQLKCTVETDYRIRGKSIPPISLPHLEKIVLDLHTPVQRDVANPNPILLLRKEFNVNYHLFFKKGKDDDVNIEITVNGCSFFKWCPAEKEVIIGFGEPHSEPFLERLKDKKVMKRFNTLTIVNNKLANVMSETAFQTFPGSTVKDVMLWGVEDESSLQLGDFLRTFVNLESLRVWAKGPLKEEDEREENSPPREISVINIRRDLTSGEKLVKLSICEVALLVHPEDNIASIVKANVTEFYSHNCHFSPEIYAHFDKIFPKLRKVSFGYNGFTVTKKFLLGQQNGNKSKRRKISAKEKTVTLMNSQTVQLVNNILKIKDIELIRITDLNWELGPKNSISEKNVKDFLKRAGWPTKKKYKDVLLADFLVRKDPTTGEWGLDTEINPDGQRTASNTREYDRYWDYMDKLFFKFFMLDRVFKDLETFQN